MTRVIFHGSIKALRGKIGDLIFRQLPDGTTVVSLAQPPRNSRQKKRAKLKRSPRQKAHNKRFRKAVAYARAAQVHPVYKKLAARKKMSTAYGWALSDWMNPPEVHSIKRQAGCIRVKASDNVLVTKVQVKVLDEDESVLETGEAIRGKRDCWEFASQTKGKTVVAEAWDLPGHAARLVL